MIAYSYIFVGLLLTPRIGINKNIFLISVDKKTFLIFFYERDKTFIIQIYLS